MESPRLANNGRSVTIYILDKGNSLFSNSKEMYLFIK